MADYKICDNKSHGRILFETGSSLEKFNRCPVCGKQVASDMNDYANYTGTELFTVTAKDNIHSKSKQSEYLKIKESTDMRKELIV